MKLDSQIDPRIARFFVGFTSLTGLLILFFFYSALAKLLPAHSDGAYLILYADEILKGNVFLQGWNLTSVGFYTELPFYVVGVKLMGVHPDLMRLVPSAIHAINIMLSLAVVWKFRIVAGWFKYLPVIAFLAMPSSGLWPYALTPAIHMVTLTAGLILFLLINDQLELTTRHRQLTSIAVVLLATWADTAFVFYFLIPLAIAGIVKCWPSIESAKAFSLRTVAPLALGAILGHGLLHMFKITGLGAPVQIFETGFEEPLRAANKLENASHAWWNFFGGDFWGRAITAESVSIFILGLYFFLWLRMFFRTLRERESGIDLCFALMLPLMLAALVLSSKEAAHGARFLVPAFFGAVFLMCRHIQRPSPNGINRVLVTGALVASVIASVSFVGRHRMLLAGDSFGSNFRRAFEALEQRKLFVGFGDYWGTHVMRVVSKGELEVVPINILDDVVYRFPWAAGKSWFQTTRGRFMLVHGGIADNFEDHVF